MSHRLVLSIVSMGSLMVFGACGMAPMASKSTTLTTRPLGATEVPAVTTDAAGVVEASLLSGTNVQAWKITFSGLSGPATGAHFQGPAMVEQNAAVVVPIGAPLGSPNTGSAMLTPGHAADLAAGNSYVNLHTAVNPNGEARGQFTVRP
jgi:hypothetical protein